MPSKGVFAKCGEEQGRWAAVRQRDDGHPVEMQLIEQPRVRVRLVLEGRARADIVTALAAIFALPNVLPEKVDEMLPRWYSQNRINLGLDLRGGAHFLLEVDLRGVMNERLTNLSDTLRGEFIYDNLMIAANVIHAAHVHGAEKLMFLGSSCIYPRLAPQPIRENSLLTGPFEPTNEAYAIAKIAGYMMCRAYWRQYGFKAISLMPTNLYGPHDNFDPTSSHVLPGLIRRFHEAKIKGLPEVAVWGTGTPRRELMHSDDLAEAAVMTMNTYDSPDIINVGTGQDVSIAELAALVKDVIGYQGKLTFDATKPDGMPLKRLDVSRIHALGWQAKISLSDGIRETYRWFLSIYQ